MSRIRIDKGKGKRRRVRVGRADPSVTGNAGMAAVTELCERLDVIGLLNAATGPIKQRDRGFGPGQLLVGMAAAQLAGQDFLVGLDRHRADVAGQALTPVPGLASTTAAGLARRMTEQHWRATESGLAAVTERMLALLPAERSAALCEGQATIDMDATDVEVYGRKKDGVAYNHQGQRVGRPHVASWAETETVLAADLGSGVDDPRATAEDLLNRALAGLPRRIRRERVTLRADAGYFAGQLARAAHTAGIGFAIGAKRVTTMWRALAGIAETDWRAAIDMPDAQVAVSDYAPADWPPDTRLLIRRVRLWPDQVSAVAAPPHPAPRPARAAAGRARRRRRNLRVFVHPDQPRREHPGPGRRGRALVPAPHQRGEHLPRQQTRRRAAAPAVGQQAGQHRVDVGRAARRQHRRLAAPTHCRPRRRRHRHRGRSRRSRRQGHDRHPAPPPDRDPGAGDPARPHPHPAARTRLPRPARPDPHSAARTARTLTSDRKPSPRTVIAVDIQAALWPRPPQPNIETRNPAHPAGPARLGVIQDHPQTRRSLLPGLLAESGLTRLRLEVQLDDLRGAAAHRDLYDEVGTAHTVPPLLNPCRHLDAVHLDRLVRELPVDQLPSVSKLDDRVAENAWSIHYRKPPAPYVAGTSTLH
ncbi:MAG: transposase [Mycobacterium sp.]